MGEYNTKMTRASDPGAYEMQWSGLIQERGERTIKEVVLGVSSSTKRFLPIRTKCFRATWIQPAFQERDHRARLRQTGILT